MKKMPVIIASVIMATSLNVSAKESITLKDKAGIKPDSIFYSIDTKLDDLKIKKASTKEEKVNAISEVAEERLGESEAMAEVGKQELVKDAVNQYNQKLDQAISELKSIDKNLDDEEIKKT